MDSNGQEGRFPTTHWSFIARVGQQDPSCEAFEQFLKRYLPALRAFLRRGYRLGPEQADDLLHDFLIEKVMMQRVIAHADERRGRFRTFLITVLKNFLKTQQRKEVVANRAVTAKAQEAGPDVSGTDAVDAFDRAWAEQVLAETVRRFEAECHCRDQARIWGIFEARVLEPIRNGAQPPAYDQVVASLGFANPMQASNALITAKRAFARQLRLVVGEYARDEQEVRNEIAHLRRVLASRPLHADI